MFNSKEKEIERLKKRIEAWEKDFQKEKNRKDELQKAVREMNQEIETWKDKAKERFMQIALLEKKLKERNRLLYELEQGVITLWKMIGKDVNPSEGVLSRDGTKKEDNHT